MLSTPDAWLFAETVCIHSLQFTLNNLVELTLNPSRLHELISSQGRVMGIIVTVPGEITKELKGGFRYTEIRQQGKQVR